MTTVSTSPLYAPPKREVQVRFALTEGGSNYVRVWVTRAPPDSELRGKLEKSTQNRFPVYSGDGGDGAAWSTTFDLGGKYTLVAQEYQRGASAYGGGYQGSPDGDPSETKIGAETTLSLYIGQRLTSEIATQQDRATLVVWVFNDTIRETTLAVHGEDSPALQSDTPTPGVLAAIEASTVRTALLALRNVGVTVAVGILNDVQADLVTKWNAHLVQGGVHNADDTDNDIPEGLAGAASSASAAQFVTEFIPKVRQHYANDAAAGLAVAGRDSGDYHHLGSGKKNDNANLPIVAGASQLGDAYWATAELWRSLTAHFPNTAVHTSADNVNTPTALPALMQVATALFGVLASTSPPTPPTQSPGAMTLIAAAGFTETPLE